MAVNTKARAIDIDHFKKKYSYNPRTGVFRNRLTKKRCPPSSKVQFVGRYLAHRVAWAWVHGDPGPRYAIEHKNGDRRDNRIANLYKKLRRDIPNFDAPPPPPLPTILKCDNLFHVVREGKCVGIYKTAQNAHDVVLGIVEV